MVDVSNGVVIRMTRGDTFRAKVTMRNKQTKEEYVPVEGDRIVFTVKATADDSSPVVITQDIPIDTQILELSPNSTKQLPMPSNYCYDIALIKDDGTVDTFITKGVLRIEPEVG